MSGSYEEFKQALNESLRPLSEYFEEQPEPLDAEELALEADWRYQQSFVLGHHTLVDQPFDEVSHWVVRVKGDAPDETVDEAIDLILHNRI